jgi:hypothetical protein
MAIMMTSIMDVLRAKIRQTAGTCCGGARCFNLT